MSRDEREELSKMFKNLDKSGDGVLDKSEIQRMIKEYGHIFGDTDVQTIIRNVDIDGSGRIDYSEFIAATASQVNLLSVVKLKEAFHFFDKDNSGSISTEEIKEILRLSTIAEA